MSNVGIHIFGRKFLAVVDCRGNQAVQHVQMLENESKVKSEVVVFNGIERVARLAFFANRRFRLDKAQVFKYVYVFGDFCASLSNFCSYFVQRRCSRIDGEQDVLVKERLLEFHTEQSVYFVEQVAGSG